MIDPSTKNQVIEVVEKICGFEFSDTECTDEDDLLKNGVLDSSAFIQVLLEIGKAAGIEIIDEDIMNPEHTCIAGLSKLIQNRRQNEG